MSNPQNFIERGENEPLAVHLYRNAEVIGADVDQRRRLRMAASLCVRGNHPPYSATEAGRQDRVEAGKIADAVQRELRDAIQQALYLAQAMGESVVPFNTAGAVRIRERDGLWGALESGVITSAMAEAGFEYRARFEAAGAQQLGSQLGRVGEGSIKASSSHGATAAGLFRAYAGVQVTTAEAHVLTADPTQRALTVLRAVAGEGRTIRSLGHGGNTRAANGKALALALPIVARSLTETGGLRIRAA